MMLHRIRFALPSHRRTTRVGLLLASLWLSACSPPEPQAVSEETILHEKGEIIVTEKSPLRKSLVINPVEPQAISQPFIVPSNVEADPARLVRILPPMAGRIVALHKRLGDEVREGDPLFSLDSADMAQAYADYHKARSQLLVTQRNLQRQEELGRDGIAARKEIDAAQNDYEQARSEEERTHARLDQLGLKITPKGAGRLFTLHSPISGRVVELPGAQGGYWNDLTQPIMTVADLSSVWLTANVQEKDLAKVFIGQPVKLTLNAYPDMPVDGKVRYIGEILDPDTRTVKVRVSLDNTQGIFKPGMFARAEFMGKRHDAIVVPTTALVQSDMKTRVFVEVSPWHFVAREVKTGAQIGGITEILSGLKAGERIVTKEGVVLND